MQIKARTFREFNMMYPVVSSLLILNLCFFILTTIPIFPNIFFIEKMAGVNILIADGEWWRILTPILLHADFSHFLFNSFTLLLFGCQLEPMVKRIHFILIYFSSGIFANVCTYIFAPLTYVHVGSSGALFGIFGVFLALILFKKLPKEETQLIGILILIAVILSFIQKEVNLYAHIFGLIWGFLSGIWIIRHYILNRIV